jgi:hypothetical protein
MKLALALASALMLTLPAAGHAAMTQTFSTSQSEFDPGVRNQGWWSPTAPNDNFNQNYIVGRLGNDDFRNFFTFDLSSACQASSATLQLIRFDQTGPLTYSLFDVSTPAATLNANNGTSRTIFTDLGTGTRFGSFRVPDGAVADVLSFPLSSAGVSAFNGARGGFFSIGGSIVLPSFVQGFLYGSSDGTGTQQLVATCVPPVPKTKDQCKSGGWRNFPGFTNEGDCVSFVATHGKNPPGTTP